MYTIVCKNGSPLDTHVEDENGTVLQGIKSIRFHVSADEPATAVVDVYTEKFKADITALHTLDQLKSVAKRFGYKLVSV